MPQKRDEIIHDTNLEIAKILDNETKYRLQRMISDMQQLMDIDGGAQLAATLQQLQLGGATTQLAALPADPGRLVITDDWHIILPDNDNAEVQVDTLAKTLYFLFLLHPDGINRADIVDHKDTLMEIYLRVAGDDADLERMERSIDRLCDITDNSINEKMSRLKRAFNAVLPRELTPLYIPTGPRGGAKRINLPADKITLPQRLTFLLDM